MKVNKAGALLGVLSIIGVWLASTASAQVGRQMPDEGQQHISVGTPAKYGHYPPTSGPHWPRVASWGVHEEELPPEIWVHNLEHGGVVILYRCELPCPDLVRQLEEVYRTFPGSKYGHVKLVITPYPRLRTRLAILAWTWIDEMMALDRERLLRFYQAHVDKGPEDVP
jgi:hypothetical protein